MNSDLPRAAGTTYLPRHIVIRQSIKTVFTYLRPTILTAYILHTIMRHVRKDVKLRFVALMQYVRNDVKLHFSAT